MITHSMPRIQQLSWIDELRAAYVKPGALLRDLELDISEVDLREDGAGFPFRVPRPFARRMRRRDPHDPLLLQVLPLNAEAATVSGFGTDPVDDLNYLRAPNLLQKYYGRALLIVTGGCAINCRYCFRRHFPYAAAVGTESMIAAMAEIGADESLSEIILSGGDPLMQNDDQIAELIDRIAAIRHVRRLRIHTRLPVTIPARLTDRLVSILTGTRLRTVIVLHINHPNEIDTELRLALRSCTGAGITFLNQSVLLAGINDDPGVLAELSEALFDASVLPYYVHLLDPVAGAAHFRVDDDTVQKLSTGLRSRLPGYLVPRFVRDCPGEAAKSVIA